jgi:UPF0716 family protein affecting phage T7 exclusion
MRSSLLIIIGVIILIIPGGLPLLIVWGILFPQYRREDLKRIIKMKKEIIIAMDQSIIKIKGMRWFNDKQYNKGEKS